MTTTHSITAAPPLSAESIASHKETSTGAEVPATLRKPSSKPKSELDVDSLFKDERFRIITETIVDGLIVIDAQGTIRCLNNSCEQLFGYSQDELVGQNVSVLMPEPFSSRHDSFLHRHRETKVQRIIGIGRELTGKKSTGEVFPMYLSVGETLVDGDTYFVGVIYDITEKRRSEELLLHHQKLDAIGQLSGGVAHDFNNILSVISGNLEIVEGHELPPAAKRAIARAQDAAERAARITHRLLAFARRQPLTKISLDLNEALYSLSNLLERTIGENIEIGLDLAESLPMVEVDIDQFETAILNLVTNSRDAMPNGGRIRVSTLDCIVTEPAQATQDVPAGHFVRVSVADEGDGMSAETLERSVDPFFTTKDKGSGTGLGLSMVYGFLKQLGGHVRILSEPNVGTSINLYFPCAEKITTEQMAKPTHSPVGMNETILVVEDDPDVREVTVARLESLNYRVRVAENGRQALSAIVQNADIDLVLTDVVMPGGMDGHQLADEVQALTTDMPVILTSGYSEAMASGFSANSRRTFLAKPVSRLKLATTLREYLDADS